MNGGGATDVESNVVEDFCPSRVVLLVEEHTDLFFFKGIFVMIAILVQNVKSIEE